MSDAPKAVFLSYAREDADAARRIAEALRGFGVEVWFDQAELRGGDAWDAKIKKQIRECALFVAMISSTTQSRGEGYFRREWKLAVERTHDMAASRAFLVPVVVDDTTEADAEVPEEFMRVQWTRLPGGLPTPQFVEQVKRLLTGSGGGRRAPGEERSAGTSSAPPVSRMGLWIVSGIAVVALGVVAVLLISRQPGKETPPSPTAPSAVTPPPAAPVSEARQLVAKARALYEPWDLAPRDNFKLAEDLLERAVKLDPTDGDAWGAYALLSCAHLVVLADTSPERRTALRTQIERAWLLAPNADLSRFVRAFGLRFTPETVNESIRLLREEAVRQPNNRLLLRTLGLTLRGVGQTDQATIYFDKAVALPGPDPITQYVRSGMLETLGRFGEAEAAIDESLAMAPTYVKAHRVKIGMLLDYHGDLEGARAHLRMVPPGYLADEAASVLAAIVWLYSRDGFKVLEALRNVSDFPQASGINTFPAKAYIAGWAHQLAGSPEAARTEWRAGLLLVERRLAAQPNSATMLWRKAHYLALTGERAAAEALLPELRQRVRAGQLSRYALGSFLVALGRVDDAFVELDEHIANPLLTGGEAARRNELRYHPMWDAIRADPRFQAILRGYEKKK